MRQAPRCSSRGAIVLISGIATLAAMMRFPQSEGRAANLDLISIYADPLIIYWLRRLDSVLCWPVPGLHHARLCRQQRGLLVAGGERGTGYQVLRPRDACADYSGRGLHYLQRHGRGLRGPCGPRHCHFVCVHRHRCWRCHCGAAPSQHRRGEVERRLAIRTPAVVVRWPIAGGRSVGRHQGARARCGRRRRPREAPGQGPRTHSR